MVVVVCIGIGIGILEDRLVCIDFGLLLFRMRFVFMRRLSSIELNIDVRKKYSRYPLVTCYSIPTSHKILCRTKN